MQRLTCDFNSKANTEFKVILLRTENCLSATLLLLLAHPLTNSHYFEFYICWTVHHFDNWGLQPGHYSSLTTPNLQPTANQGMYNFRFTILINTNNTSSYQSTNETCYTQENTTITKHKGSQLLILIETRCQLQPIDKELLTEHTPLRTINLH